MGMFDRLYDKNTNEWQTKALGRALTSFRIGDKLDKIPDFPISYQLKVLGGPHNRYGLATVKDGILTELPAAKDLSLPQLDYFGNSETNSGETTHT